MAFLYALKVTLPPSSIQPERDSGVQLCPVGRFVQRGLAVRSAIGLEADVSSAAIFAQTHTFLSLTDTTVFDTVVLYMGF
jgi:hypothetical protein